MGGLILGNADCASSNFTTAFRKLGGELFPAYEFRELPADHVIYTRQQYQRSSWKNPPSVLGVSNGVRELMLLIPAADPARAWQMKLYRGKEELHQIASDIVLYAVDKANLRYKGDSYVLTADPAAQANGQLKVARLKYAGNWDPEPGGWRRQAILMKNQQGITVEVTPVQLGTGKLDKSYKVAHLTGTAKLTLDAASRAEIKQFVDGGGILLVDAAGGSSEFATSAENLLREIFPDSKGLAPLPAAHPIYAGPEKIEAARYRPYAIRSLGNTQQPLLRGLEIGGGTPVICSREDFSAGLVGQSVDGIIGYQPATAQALVTNILAAAAK